MASSVTEPTILTLPPEGVLRIAVIADTHSKAHPRAAPLIAREEPHLILHAGDIGAAKVLVQFEAIAPTLAVRGNIDSSDIAPDVRVVTLRGPDDYEVRILLTHIALYGAKLRRDARGLAEEHGAHLILCGHSHVPFLGEDRGLVIFNPGSIGPRRFHLPICFGVVDLGPAVSAFRHVDCETGERWNPPAG